MAKESIEREGIKSRSEPWGMPTFKGQEEESRRLRKPKKQKENHKSSFTEVKEGDSIKGGMVNKDPERKAPTGWATGEAMDEGGKVPGNNRVKGEVLQNGRLGGGK